MCLRLYCARIVNADAEREIKLWFSPDDIIESPYPVKIVKAMTEKKVWA